MARLDISGRTAVVALGQSVVKSVQIVFALVLVRLLTQDEWPAMALLLTMYNAATNIGSLNLHMSFIFFFGHVAQGEKRKLVVQTVLLLLGAGMVCGLLLLGVGPFLGERYHLLTGLLPLLALAVVLELPTMLLPQLLLALEKPGASSFFNGAMGALQFVGIMTPIMLGYGLDGAMYGLLAYAIARFGVFALVMARLAPRGEPFRWDKAFLRTQVVYTAPLSFSMATSVLNRNMDKWLVAGFDPANFGAYALAAYEVPFVSLIPFAIGAVLSTRMIHAFKHDKVALAKAYWDAATSRMMLLIVPLTLAVVAAAPEIVQVFFTANYLEAIIPFQIYSLIMLHRFAEYGAVLRAAGDTKSIWWSSCTILVAGVALNLPLVLIFGMVGVAAGTLGANLVAWLFILSRIARAFKVPFSRVVQWRLYLSVLSLCGVLALGVMAGAAVFFPLETVPGVIVEPLSDMIPSVSAEHVSAIASLLLKLAIFFTLYMAALRLMRLKKRCHEIPEDDEHFLSQQG